MRFIVTPWLTKASPILSESTSPIFFCSAFATAESSTLLRCAQHGAG